MKQVGIPLVLTFSMEEVSFDRLDTWRSKYFPKERNHLKAHLTIYHQLPGQRIHELRELLSAVSQLQTAIPVKFSSLLLRQGFLGVRVESEKLNETKLNLDKILDSYLRVQDRKEYKPHVTLSNFGSPKEALRSFAELEKIFVPWDGYLTGMALFHYRGGPWEHDSSYFFDAT